MPPSLWEALRREADEEGISVADFVRGSSTYALGMRHGIALAQEDGPTAELVLKVLGLAPPNGDG